MKRTKVFYEGGFYLFESKVVANSNYIESLNEAKQLLMYANYYLKDYLKIYDYVITRHGWQLVIKLNSAKNIPRSKEIEIWRILSERVRLFISTYVRQINANRGRTGALVHSKYQRYYFETLREATEQLNKMRNQQIKLYQRKKKYRGIKKHFRISKVCRKGSIFLCSKEIKRKRMESQKIIDLEVFCGLQNFVVPKLITYTFKKHQSQKTHPNRQNSS